MGRERGEGERGGSFPAILKALPLPDSRFPIPASRSRIPPDPASQISESEFRGRHGETSSKHHELLHILRHFRSQTDSSSVHPRLNPTHSLGTPKSATSFRLLLRPSDFFFVLFSREYGGLGKRSKSIHEVSVHRNRNPKHSAVVGVGQKRRFGFFQGKKQGRFINGRASNLA